MIARRLGRSGIQVSAVGMGCWAIGGPFERTDGELRSPMGWGRVDDAEFYPGDPPGARPGGQLFRHGG